MKRYIKSFSSFQKINENDEDPSSNSTAAIKNIASINGEIKWSDPGKYLGRENYQFATPEWIDSKTGAGDLQVTLESVKDKKVVGSKRFLQVRDGVFMAKIKKCAEYKLTVNIKDAIKQDYFEVYSKWFKVDCKDIYQEIPISIKLYMKGGTDVNDQPGGEVYHPDYFPGRSHIND
jgi:hypothetical protein